jgi:hypothetical protein
VQPANGSTQSTLAATQDSFTRGATPTSNHGTQTFMRVKAQGEKVSFAAFDVSSLSGTVTSAVLKLFVRDLIDPGTVQVHAVQEPWSETTITHNTRPQISAPVTSRSISSAQHGTTIEIDITSIVQGWQASPTTAYGVAISAADALHVRFDTRDGINAPAVEVDISGP